MVKARIPILFKNIISETHTVALWYKLYFKALNITEEKNKVKRKILEQDIEPEELTLIKQELRKLSLEYLKLELKICETAVSFETVGDIFQNLFNRLSGLIITSGIITIIFNLILNQKDLTTMMTVLSIFISIIFLLIFIYEHVRYIYNQFILKSRNEQVNRLLPDLIRDVILEKEQ